ncbi:hypothetical protein NECID01_0685 [Nematocida sp. AWRm77]|nr:hypothetical protein NECID01_0685 [Nematocida sp. AWRm77]
MSKEYKGMTFSLEPKCVPKTAEEQEIADILNRHLHGDDLEDNFFEMADGERNRHVEDAESSIEEVSDERMEECSSVRTLHYSGDFTDGLPSKTYSAFAPAQKKDTLESLIEEINLQSKEQFDQLSMLTERRRKEKRKKQKKTPDYTECNMILNRLGALHTNEEVTESNEPKKTGFSRTRTQTRQKRKDKPSSCGNWEDAAGTTKHKPNII